MPKRYRDLNLSPFLYSKQREVFGEFSSLLEECNADDDRCWTCFAWKLGAKAGQRRGRIYFGRDELVLMLDHAVQWLRARGYWWPMIGFVVESPPRSEKRRDGRWHVHIVEIADRLPSRAQRELIREALRRSGFSDVRLDDLTLSSSDLAWWKPREEAKDDGHEGFGRYAAKNAAEHDSKTPFAVYRTSNVPGSALPGEEVTREILRAAKSCEPKADAPGHPRPVGRAPAQPAHANHQAAQTAQETTGGLRLPRCGASGGCTHLRALSEKMGLPKTSPLREENPQVHLHPNAKLTPRTRRSLIDRIQTERWPVARAARAAESPPGDLPTGTGWHPPLTPRS